MAKAVLLLASVAAFLILISQLISPSYAFVIPVEVQQVKNDHGFYTTEDPIALTITVTNNSTERAHFHVSGTQTDMDYQKVFNPGIEPADFDLEPGKPYTFSRLMDNRWEGPFRAQFALEGRSLESNLNYTGYGFLPYIVHPPSDVFDKQNVEYNRWIAVASIGGAVGGPVAAIIAMRRQSSDSKKALEKTQELHRQNIEKAEAQHKAELTTLKEQVNIAREALNREHMAKWDEKYYNHSKQISNAIFDGWIRQTDYFASCSYESERFVRREPRAPSTTFIDQSIAHLKVGYPETWQTFQEAQAESLSICNKIQSVIQDYQNYVMQAIKNTCPELTPVGENWSVEMNNTFFSDRLIHNIFQRSRGRQKRENYNIQVHEINIFPKDEAGNVKEKRVIVMSLNDGHLAVGNEQILIRLKGLTYSLINSETTLDYVKKYESLMKEFGSKEKWRAHDRAIRTIWESVEGGASLLGEDSCTLCPDKPAKI